LLAPLDAKRGEWVPCTGSMLEISWFNFAVIPQSLDLPSRIDRLALGE
jgi:hypothetical protein